jgi:hypothetical protein
MRFNRHIYHTFHGPQVWPWWKILSVNVVRCTHDPVWAFWITPISYNIWIYSRWGALCLNLRERRGVYRTEETGLGRYQ